MFVESCSDVRVEFEDVLMTGTLVGRHCLHEHVDPCIDALGNNCGSLYSLDWTTGLDYWTGILDSPLTPKIAYKRLHLAPYSLVGQMGL